jgi:uncharacterized cupredoxin-like copper-binding protein
MNGGSMKRRLISTLGALLVGAIVVAGCGGGGSSSSSSSSSTTSTPASTTQPSTTKAPSGSAQTLQIAADPGGALRFDKTALSAKAGTVEIVMDNPSSLPHAVAVEGNGVDKDGQTVTNGGKSTVSADLKAGTYTFYCPVDGHRQAGMMGTLTVK